MDTTFLIAVVSASLIGSWCAWIAYTKWQAQGLWRFLGAIAVAAGTWGVSDWVAQKPRETPLYAYVLLALAPAVLVGSWLVLSS